MSDIDLPATLARIDLALARHNRDLDFDKAFRREVVLGLATLIGAVVIISGVAITLSRWQLPYSTQCSQLLPPGTVITVPAAK